MATTNNTNCPMSGVRVHLSVGEEVARQTHCPKPNGCGRLLKVRPTRNPSGQFARHYSSGNPTATLPRHQAQP